MELRDLYLKRQSCRSFDKNGTVDLKTVVACVKTAGLAPSGCNGQSYCCRISEGEEKKRVQEAYIFGESNAFIRDSSLILTVVKLNEPLISSSGRVVDKDFSEIDTGLFIAHLILALAEKGIDSCIIGLIDQEKVRAALGTNNDAVLALAVGHATESYPLRPKMRKTVNRLLSVNGEPFKE